MGEFVSGLRLARTYYDGAVRPLLRERFAGLPYAAGLAGRGSEVLGFDSRRSTDHDWGPRLQVFLRDQDLGRYGDEIGERLVRDLPVTWQGYPTAFARTRDPDPRHRVEVTSVGTWFRTSLGIDPRAGVAVSDWLAMPTQRLAEVTGGEVFHDEPGELTAARATLAWYPRDVWRYVLACQWRRIAEEEAFPGRCVEVGDRLGASVVTARLVRDLMRLCLLMHRRYPPYGKWLGTAFTRLAGHDGLVGRLTDALTESDWASREKHLTASYEMLARQHNRLGLTAPLDPTTRPFHDRPYLVLGADRFADALCAGIEQPEIRRLPRTGTIDQFVDSTDVLENPSLSARIAAGLRS